MRFKQYKAAIQLCVSICETVDHMIQSRSMDMMYDFLTALKSISNFLMSNNNSLKSGDIIQTVISISKVLSDSGNEPSLEKLYELSCQLYQQCRDGLDYKLKVLFVSELGEKWDSMESVYREFKNRSDCEIDVVIEPIVRTISLTDGSTRSEVIYEDYLTPLGIRHILYNNYSFEDEEPDITFISQPYESATLPMFWPENIAKHSKLVYLPYFNNVSLNRELSSAFDLFLMKFQQYSWKILCQSETMKMIYKACAPQKGKNAIAAGLPKSDYVKGLNRENTPCPEEWRKNLSGKKVFLWTTHYIAPNSGSQFLDKKGADFLKFFSNDPNIALIWRPHPMTKTVLDVHAPELLPAYNNLIKTIKNSDNMVLDENKSYAPAFVWSDALISDFSSMLDQYLHLNKPILHVSNMSQKEAEEMFCSENTLFDYSKIEFSYSNNDTLNFIKRVCSGIDTGKENREYLLRTYFPLDDGNAGKRVAKAVIEDFKKEFTPVYAKLETRTKRIGTNVLVVGSMKDSLPCIKQLEENGLDYYICDLFVTRADAEKHKLFSLSETERFDYDFIVITHKTDYNTAKEILMENGAEERKILEYWKLYKACVPLMVCDRVMMNPKTESYDGIILGLSHSEVGIIPERLNGSFCNLSLSSQDLYFQLKTLQYCLEKYPQKLSALKYAIIETHDYNYFNFDTTLGHAAYEYLFWGGYNKDPHNFNKNPRQSLSFDDAMCQIQNSRLSGIRESELEIWERYFCGAPEKAGYEGFCGNYDLSKRTKTVSDADIDNYLYERGTVIKKHDDTIRENASCLKAIFDTLIKINPDIKIYSVVIPKYIATEKRDFKHLSQHKIYFNRIIEDLKKKYSFTHIDFKECSDISFHRELYFDAAHLNIYGAQVFTDMLNNIISNDSCTSDGAVGGI